jgi:hypothetical protein
MIKIVIDSEKDIIGLIPVHLEGKQLISCGELLSYECYFMAK